MALGISDSWDKSGNQSSPTIRVNPIKIVVNVPQPAVVCYDSPVLCIYIQGLSSQDNIAHMQQLYKKEVCVLVMSIGSN